MDAARWATEHGKTPTSQRAHMEELMAWDPPTDARTFAQRCFDGGEVARLLRSVEAKSLNLWTPVAPEHLGPVGPREDA